MKFTKIAVVIGLAVVATAVAGTVSAGTDPAPIVATTTPGPTVPAGYQQVVDDTGLLLIDVPATWTDISTAPTQTDDGNPIPTIEASTSIDQYETTWSVPGVTYSAYPAGADTADAVATADFSADGGSAGAVELYDDGLFVGHLIRWTGMGAGGTAEMAIVAAYPPDQSFLAVLWIQTTGPTDQPVVQTLLDTFTYYTGATTPTTPSNTTVGPTVAPTVAPTVGPAVATPPTAGFTLAPSLDVLITSFNEFGNQLNADPGQQNPVIVLAPEMFTTVPSGTSNVFGGYIGDDASMGGRLDPATGAVLELVVWLYPSMPEADFLVLASATIAMPNDADVEDLVATYEASSLLEVDRLHIPYDGISIVMARLGDSIGIGFMAPQADDDTAFANMEALTSALLDALPF
jgi:hypothetical protein